MAEGETRLDHLLASDDVARMREALGALAIGVADDGEQAVVVAGRSEALWSPGNAELALHLGNAGTAMRPLVAALTLAGDASASAVIRACTSARSASSTRCARSARGSSTRARRAIRRW